MKKLFAIFMAAILCISFAACGGEPENKPLTVEEAAEYFMTGDLADMNAEFEERTAGEGKPITLVHGGKYELIDYSGYNMTLFLYYFEGDIADSAGFNDRSVIVYNPETGKQYESYNIDWNNYDGEFENEDELCFLVCNLYYSLISNGETEISSGSNDIFTAFTEEEIKAINDSIAK